MPESSRVPGAQVIRVCLVAPSLSILGGQAVAAQRLLERMARYQPHKPIFQMKADEL